MQTFLPYRSFIKSAKTLDYKRLGKQRVEAMQILNVLEKKKEKITPTEKQGWWNHPAVLMWEGYEEALKEYFNAMITIWVERGCNNSMSLYKLKKNIRYPSWINSRKFHISHRSNLLRKDKKFYSQYNWGVPDDLPYIWPVQKA